MHARTASFLLLWVHTLSFVTTTTTKYPTRSGIKEWVDPDTPSNRQAIITSRGRKWHLVMSEEFNTPHRDFRPGYDHMWTSVEKPDGVNGALQLYSHNMTSTACDDDGTCYFYIKAIDEVNTVHVYNMYMHPPQFTDAYFYYRSGMVQSWNKFCYQGGMISTRVQLPGAVTAESGNPDVKTGKSTPVDNGQYYPTWPGIWMLGNLGRAIFSGSTNRMWPFSYNACEPDLFDPKNQRISACEDNPGYGLHPNQGRGAPEIDVLEGAAALISSSIQLGPGMPDEYRTIGLNYAMDDPMCIYSGTCNSPGANYPDVPTKLYSERGHTSWYSGLRYTANNFCRADPDKKQDYDAIVASLKAGIVNNTCSLTTCPASSDVNGDMGLIDGKGTAHWNVNTNGTCFPRFNVYLGSYLCDPDNTNPKCPTPRNSSTPASNAMDSFNYQMDAVSTNWPVHVGAYMEFLRYDVEWVTGKNGYVRWMLEGHVIFEVTSDTLINVPQNANKTNPTKIMVEEPLYIILNVAVSSAWGARPPNVGMPCRGNGTVDEVNRICDSFPQYLKIDYIRLYQDLGDDLDDDNYMTVGCDPATHPTKEWIDAHLDEYEDEDNKVVEVQGKAFCKTSDDCTIGGKMARSAALFTGKCVKKRCECLYNSWGGPRCTTAIASSTSSTLNVMSRSYGPPLGVSIALTVLACMLSIASVYIASVKSTKQTKMASQALESERKAAAHADLGHYSEVSHRGSILETISKENRHNFV